MSLYEIKKELEIGGEWLGAAREWIKWNIPCGDTMCWSDEKPVTLPFYKFTELALSIAAAAVKSERERVAREELRSKINEERMQYDPSLYCKHKILLALRCKECEIIESLRKENPQDERR